MSNTIEVTYPRYTDQVLSGGLFDQLMASVSVHLDKEYSKNRIRGADYAKVYVGSIQGVMQNTTQYLLGTMLLNEEKAKAAIEIELIQAQIDKITEEINHMKAQQELWVKQGEKLDKEIEFMAQKIITEQANTVAGIAASDSLIGKQLSLLSAQKLGFAGELQIKAANVFGNYDAVFQSVQEVPEDATLHPQAVGATEDALATASDIEGV